MLRLPPSQQEESGSCPCTRAEGDVGRTGKGGRAQGEDYPWTQLALFTAFNNKAVAIATALINASDLHN